MNKQIRRIVNFYNYWKDFGFFGAVDVVRNRNRSGMSFVRIKGIKYPVGCRFGTSDLYMMRQVLGRSMAILPLDEPPCTIVDVGANAGYTSLLYANCYPNADIVAIEPEFNNFTVLKHNTQNYPRIECVQAALWWRKENLQITNIGAANASFQVGAMKDNHSDTIIALTPQDLIKKYGRIDVLKLDVEGAEKDIFRLAQPEWLQNVGMLVVETHDRISPGCTSAVEGALSRYCPRKSRSGEYWVYKISSAP